MPSLFSYGTLRLKKVQIETFGRELRGKEDSILGFEVRQVEIIDHEVLKTSGEKFHPILIRTNNIEDRVEGTVFEITEQELEEADKYEVVDYKRISAQLKSGGNAWVYVDSKKG